MVGRNKGRLKRLEELSGEQRARRAERQERDELHGAAMEEMRSTPEGRGAIARLGELYIESGGTLEVLRTEGGLEAARSFRDALFAAQDRLREEQRGDDELRE